MADELLARETVIKRIVMKGYISSLYYAFLLDGHEYRVYDIRPVTAAGSTSRPSQNLGSWSPGTSVFLHYFRW